MAQEITRVELPSGGWADLITRPTTRDIFEKKEMLLAIAGKTHIEVDGVEVPVTYYALAAFIKKWSFKKGIRPSSILDLDIEDSIKLMQVFTDTVVPFLVRIAPSLPTSSSSSSSEGPDAAGESLPATATPT